MVNSWGRGNPQEIYPILEQTLGYDGIIVENATWGQGQTITVAFNNEQIIDKNKLANYYKTIRSQKPK